MLIPHKLSLVACRFHRTMLQVWIRWTLIISSTVTQSVKMTLTPEAETTAFTSNAPSSLLQFLLQSWSLFEDTTRRKRIAFVTSASEVDKLNASSVTWRGRRILLKIRTLLFSVYCRHFHSMDFSHKRSLKCKILRLIDRILPPSPPLFR